MKKSILLVLLFLTTTQLMAQNTLVKMQTSEGDIYLELFNDKAPLSVANFLSYANEGFYNGTLFHRVISTFMIQGGGFNRFLERKPTKEPIRNEADNGLKNLRGTIAMARLPEPHTATAQFFINVQDNASLNFKGQDAIDAIVMPTHEQSSNEMAYKYALQKANQELSKVWGYAVFGKVVRGMEVVDNIRFKKTGSKQPLPADVPIEDIVIQAVSVIPSLPE